MCIESHDTHVNSTVFTIQTLRGGCMHGDTPAKLFCCEFPLCVYDMDHRFNIKDVGINALRFNLMKSKETMVHIVHQFP